MIPGIDPDNIVYLNGAYERLGDARISVLDRGFIFGDGIYDVVPCYQGKPFCMEDHLARLMRNLRVIEIETGWEQQDWEQLVLDMLARSGRGSNSIVYIQVTRGPAKRDHAFPAQSEPTIFCMVAPFEPPSQAQRTQGLSVVSIEDKRWLNCHIKSTSLLGNVLARQQAVEAGVDEVVQFRDDYLTEGSSTNIWVVRDGVLLAPPRNHLILEGIRYRLIERLAAQCEIDFESRPITRAEVQQADELMLSSATREVLPITLYNAQPVGEGQPGPVFEQLRAAYDQEILNLGAQS